MSPRMALAALPRLGVRAVVSLALLVGLLLSPLTSSEAQAVSKPGKPSVVSVSSTAVALSWKSAKGAVAYKVKYSTSKKMTKAQWVKVPTTYAEVTGLASKKSYYMQVASIDRKGKMSRYSSARKVTTLAAGDYSVLAIRGLTATGADSSLTLTWQPRPGSSYRVAWSTISSFSGAPTKVVTEPSLTLSGLTPATRYYVRVRATTAEGTATSAYTSGLAVRTLNSEGWAYATPGGLSVGSMTRTAFVLSWQRVADASRYRVQYATNPSMSGALYGISSSASRTISGLTPGQHYYLKVRAIDAKGNNLSAYSSAVETTTPTELSATYLAPAPPKLNTTAPGVMTAAWASSGKVSYQLQYSTDPDFTNAKVVTTAKTSLSISGLGAGDIYFARLALSDSSGTRLSPYSTTRSVPVASQASSVRVASYNIKCTSCYSALPLEGTWYQRRDAVVATVLAQQPDVIGFQEASQARLKDPATGASINLSQFEDLANRLGDPYKLANTKRYNCVKSTTPTGCVYQDQGASQGTKIVYNSARLTLVKQGSKRLSEIKSSDNDRYVSWAIFRHRVTGKEFLFADTHLEPTSDGSAYALTGGPYYQLRITQTNQVVAEVTKQAAGRATYVVGDFNSNKWTAPSNAPYDVMIGAGFVDPLGNTFNSTRSTSGATVTNRIRTNYSSYNGFKAKAPYFSYINGTYLDYIWTSPSIRVPEWETVVNIDAQSNFVGTIPSDHNMIRADTVIP